MGTGERRRVHSRFKLPGAIGFVLVGIALVVFGALTRQWVDVVIGVVCGLYFGAIAAVVLTGMGNPWWMRSPYDPPPPAERSTTSSQR